MCYLYTPTCMHMNIIRYYTETAGVCSAHLIGDGVSVENGTVSILLQPTGPSEENRLSEFECRVDSRRRRDFFSCKQENYCLITRYICMINNPWG